MKLSLLHMQFNFEFCNNITITFLSKTHYQDSEGEGVNLKVLDKSIPFFCYVNYIFSGER